MHALKSDLVVLGVAVAGLTAGAVCYWLGLHPAAARFWAAAAMPATGIMAWDVVRSVFRRQVGVDLLALLAVVAALGFEEYLTAVIIAAMSASGHTLEGYAQARAGRDMTSLLAHAPRAAWRIQDDVLLEVELSAIRVGDQLMIKSGEVVPVDGRVQSAAATLDESVLTGESTFTERRRGDVVLSGAINAGAAFKMLADETAERSTFAGIARLVTQARLVRAPAARLADKAAIWLVPLALLLAGITWYWTDDPLRALSVIVVATPCPLILGVPVALVCGMSNCAKRGILVKGGAALELLAQAKVLFFDKTGTLTGGRARIAHIEADMGVDKTEVLRTAACLEQVSMHVTASIIVSAAQARELSLTLPDDVHEEYGAGVSGTLDGLPARVGSPRFVLESVSAPAWAAEFLRRIAEEGGSAVFVAKGGRLLGAIHLADQIRTETPRALRLLRRAGVSRIIMLTGDSRDVAASIGSAVGVDEIHAELTPAGKVAVIAKAPPGTVTLMVGDGVNDAAALASASVGVAMGARGAAASIDAADVVLLVDRLDRLSEAIQLAGATRRIALQSVALGMGMSLTAMAVAAAGYLPPAYGAALQEVIDVVAILNALRVSSVASSRGGRRALSEKAAQHFAAEHDILLPILDRLVTVADQIQTMPVAAAVATLRELNDVINGELVAHERADEREVYPVLVDELGDDDSMAPLIRTHREIFSLVRQLGRSIDTLGATVEVDVDLRKIQRILYSVEAIMRLHFAQEEEVYLSVS
ncbi:MULTISPECIES: heavy metal translocating P-type ATPase [unclassified Achromobacter]|uniref:heavy metal translocating P-type ATPase n=1 Tax=unclassified Achromobacter TaxID=2626865 RepID=UPI000B51A047|nr:MULTISPECIES: heavy metal translocating P-type ATPase [unclassified Achromobacter]OWT74691.1 heavy metal translocating P-type ATPase [Achromobacter sp. HZ34]OWT79158.1 heavy metal translocating P-type ATPase [Achromobacter sp. HZ28]